MEEEALVPPKAKLERDPEVVRLYQEGLSTPQIAERTGIPLGSLGHILRRNGVETRPATYNYPHEPGVTVDLQEAIVAGYLAGKGLVELDEEFKVNKRTVAKVLKRWGVEIRPAGKVVPERTEKTCTECGKTKPINQFWSIKRPRSQQYAPNCRACDPSRQRRYKYGLTAQAHQQLLKQQDSKCAICGVETREGRSLSVDHDHKTGAVRGLLCGYCNRALGLFEDDPERLLRAAAYLRKAGNPDG